MRYFSLTYHNHWAWPIMKDIELINLRLDVRSKEFGTMAHLSCDQSCILSTFIHTLTFISYLFWDLYSIYPMTLSHDIYIPSYHNLLFIYPDIFPTYLFVPCIVLHCLVSYLSFLSIYLSDQVKFEEIKPQVDFMRQKGWFMMREGCYTMRCWLCCGWEDYLRVYIEHSNCGFSTWF